MLIDERQNQILEIVQDKQYITVKDLEKLVYASAATIRRDLNSLEAFGLIRRVRGGAATIDTTSGELSSFLRQQSNIPEKRRMGYACVEFLNNCKSFFFDSSTTVSHIIPHLKKIHGGLAITNGLESAGMLNTIDTIKSFFVGGELIPASGACIGGTTVENISKFECDVCFFSCHGFTLSGPAESSLDQQKAKESMIAHSKLKVCVVDHTKFGQSYVIKTCALSQIDVLVTDKLPESDYIKMCEDNHIRLIVA